MDDELLKRYKELFGEEAPIPPQHIMKTLVEMKEKGTFDEKMDKYEKVHQDVKNKFKERLGRELGPDDPIFDIDFEKEDKS